MGFLSNLFKTKPKLPPADMGLLGADMHSHFIPGIDDGAATLEDSLEMLTALHAMGYRKFITTPHVMSDHYKNTPEIIGRGLEAVRSGLQQAGPALAGVAVEAAAEYYIDYDFLHGIRDKNLLTFGKNYVLVEMSFLSEPPMLNDALFELQTHGYRPVMAHAERYLYWHGDFEKYTGLKERGALVQVNISSLIGYYSPAVKRMAEELIDEGLVDLLGTDCHRMDHVHLIDACRTEPYLHKALASGKLLNSTL